MSSLLVATTSSELSRTQIKSLAEVFVLVPDATPSAHAAVDVIKERLKRKLELLLAETQSEMAELNAHTVLTITERFKANCLRKRWPGLYLQEVTLQIVDRRFRDLLEYSKCIRLLIASPDATSFFSAIDGEVDVESLLDDLVMVAIKQNELDTEIDWVRVECPPICRSPPFWTARAVFDGRNFNGVRMISRGPLSMIFVPDLKKTFIEVEEDVAVDVLIMDDGQCYSPHTNSPYPEVAPTKKAKFKEM